MELSPPAAHSTGALAVSGMRLSKIRIKSGPVGADWSGVPGACEYLAWGEQCWSHLHFDELN